MERFDAKSLALILGISPPWSIKSFILNESIKTLEIQLAFSEKKSLFGFRDSQPSQQESLGCWSYMPVGAYRTHIHAPVPNSWGKGDHKLSRLLIGQYAFLGNPSSHYSNYTRQRIAIALVKGESAETVSEFLDLSETNLNEIVADLNKTSCQIRQLAHLPTEVDPIWTKIIRNESRFKSSVLPLNFLLSKLRRNELSESEQVFELRKFFIENASILEKEIDIVSGISTRKQSSTIAQNKQKLVLPPLKNPVWLDLLSGKCRLNSPSVALNLLISRQRAAFIAGKSREDKVVAIETLRSYFRKNCRSLKKELLLLNRAMLQKQSNGIILPTPDNAIWQNILSNNDYLPSDNMAYKLLLTKLKAQIAKNANPVVRIEAAKKVRDFLAQNQKSMQKELNALVKRTANL